MRENFDPRQLVDRATLGQLMKRRDGPAALRLAVHLGLFIGAVAALAWAGFSLPWWLRAPGIVVLAFLIFTLYAPLHEATHLSAFASRRANQVVAWVTGVIYGYSPGVHTDFHFEHHRHTNHAEDPEKGLSLPTDLPLRTPLLLVLIGVLGVLPPLHSVALALAPTSSWDRLEAGWTRPEKRARLKRECGLVALIWLGGGVATALVHPTLALDLALAILLARTMHAVVTISEHEGMPVEGHQLERTRSVRSNPVLRWFWWNMNFHSEHHAWPAVPFHQLPELHRLVAGRGVHIERSYLRFYLRRGYDEGHVPGGAPAGR
jgi:fatty acid desaturase